MDRIQEAIARARQQRTGKIGRLPTHPGDAPDAPEPDAVEPIAPADARAPISPADARAPIAPADARGPIAPADGRAPVGPASGRTRSAEGRTYDGTTAAPTDADTLIDTFFSDTDAEPVPPPPPTAIRYTRTRHVDLDESRLKENRVIAGLDYDDRVEAYRQLRTQVLKILKDNNWNTLAITSPGENAGKSLTATNLAISLSREVNHTVMLVDLDLRQPSLHEMFDVHVEKGLIDYLNADATLEDVLLNPGFPRLVLLPGRALGKYSSEILSSPQMQSLVQDIRGRYADRIIVFDLPPLLRNDDALMFTPTVDATLMVVEDGVTTVDDVQRSLQLLEGSNLIGTILNKARG